jgi:hypothetical protein
MCHARPSASVHSSARIICKKRGGKKEGKKPITFSVDMTGQPFSSSGMFAHLGIGNEKEWKLS